LWLGGAFPANIRTPATSDPAMTPEPEEGERRADR
jgi:hypothetical protein